MASTTQTNLAPNQWFRCRRFFRCGLWPVTTQVRHEVVCQAIVRGYEPIQLIGGIIQGDRQVAISNAAIADAQWPQRASDRCVIDGRTTTIRPATPAVLRNKIVLHLIQVRG
jgi:hypothetical protein